MMTRLCFSRHDRSVHPERARAAMILAYDETRVSTKDVDALFADAPSPINPRSRHRMNGPTPGSLNQAGGYVSRSPGHRAVVFDHV